MAERKPQTLANHARYVPAYHFLVFGILTINLLYRGYLLFKAPGLGTGIDLLLAVAFPLIALYARVFPLAAQDRVIRLEERLRLARLLPPNLQERIPELSTRQLVALRFASDEELAELTEKVLAGGIKDTGAIKSMIRTWRPDYTRV